MNKRECQEWIVENILPEHFKGKVWLSALGARVCYSSKGLNYLLKEDKRIIDPVRRAEFLSKLGNLKHFSVFGHSFIYVSAEDVAVHLAANLFKTYYDGDYPNIVGISLRHYLEAVLDTKGEKAFKEVFEYFKSFEEEIPDIQVNEEEIPIVKLVYKDNSDHGYAVFFIDNVSRALTHQLVRHTTLNFSQRSDRYVKNDENYMIIPKTINEDLKRAFKFFDTYSRKFYKKLVNDYHVKREDARSILPTNNRTTIVVSGPLPYINDFISKRTCKDAQSEIREVAQKMREELRW